MKILKLAPGILIVTITLFSMRATAEIQMNPLIVNGRPVAAGESYAAHTVAVGDREIFCSGVIIGPHHILTAAHCQVGLLGGKVYFGVDAAHFENRTITAVTPHPDYCSTTECGSLSSVDDFDILVAEFSGDLPFGFSAVPVAAKADLVAGTKIHLAGYGANEFGRYEDILKVTEVPMERIHGVSEFQTIETASGSCVGDSGGPGFIKKNNQLLVAGITSRGDGPCRSLGIYTLVDYFSEWIHGVTN